MSRTIQKWLVRLLILVVLGFLLWWALRNVPLVETWSAIRRLRLWQVAALLGMNALIYAFVTLRWWIVVRAEAKRVPYLPLLGVRLSVFGVSYFTLGPQVGGEPLQILFLQRKYGITFTRAASSVLMDKLLEFLVNFLLLALGLVAIVHAGILNESGSLFSWEMAGLLLLTCWPPAHLALLYNHHYPITALVRFIPFIPKKSKAFRFLHAAEWLAGDFCRRHFHALLGALGISLLAGAGMLCEYALMISFLGIHLSFWKTIAAWTAGWLAFLMPLPGGLGALEAGQVFVLGRFGVRKASALSLILLMRGRDLLIGGIGLLLAGTGSWRKKFGPA
jgi:uncharacterized protein (TIRG00374 family)